MQSIISHLAIYFSPSHLPPLSPVARSLRALRPGSGDPVSGKGCLSTKIVLQLFLFSLLTYDPAAVIASLFFYSTHTSAHRLRNFDIKTAGFSPAPTVLAYHSRFPMSMEFRGFLLFLCFVRFCPCIFIHFPILRILPPCGTL